MFFVGSFRAIRTSMYSARMAYSSISRKNDFCKKPASFKNKVRDVVAPVHRDQRPLRRYWVSMILRRVDQMDDSPIRRQGCAKSSRLVFSHERGRSQFQEVPPGGPSLSACCCPFREHPKRVAQKNATTSLSIKPLETVTSILSTQTSLSRSTVSSSVNNRNKIAFVSPKK